MRDGVSCVFESRRVPCNKLRTCKSRASTEENDPSFFLTTESKLVLLTTELKPNYKHLAQKTFAIDLSKPLYFYLLASCRQSPGVIAHGQKIGTDYRHGKTVWYQCDEGYTLEGNDRLTCRDGRWDLKPPECKGKYIEIKTL